MTNRARTSASVKFKVTLILALGWTGLVLAKPLDYETVTSLLPVEPQNVNETMAAVVVDPVVKDAVKQVAGNGSLNGLVVKRKVLVMPVNHPQKVISQRDQVFVVPTEHLLDVQKNITNSTGDETDVDEFAKAERNPIFGGAATVTENAGEILHFTSKQLGLDRSGGSGESESEESSDDESVGATSTSSRNSAEKVTVPIVAVIDPPKNPDGDVKAPIVAILPNQVNGHVLKTQLDFLNGKREQIEDEVQQHIDENSLTLDPETWSLAPAFKVPRPSAGEINPPVSFAQPIDGNRYLTTLVIPSVEIVPAALADEGRDADGDDMDVAEDIIFRPLFRYRQEAAERARYRAEEDGYRRSSFRRRRPYGDYDYYPQRNYQYRSRYNDYYQ